MNDIALELQISCFLRFTEDSQDHPALEWLVGAKFVVSCLDKNQLSLRVDLVQCSIQVFLLVDDLTLSDLKLGSGQFLIRLSCAV